MSRLAVVIPTLNAAAGLPAALASLSPAQRLGYLGPVIVSDGGSSDATLDIARKAGCAIVTGAQGRGAQLAAGAGAARGQITADDWLMFVHADTVMQPGWAREAKAFMARHAGRDRAGYFRFALDDMSPAARRLEAAVRLRCQLFALPYGDQALVINAGFYDRLGGYKPMPLFEDVDLVRRITRARLEPLHSAAVTSAAKFRAEGYGRRSRRNLVLLARYFMGADPGRLAAAYRR
ncbi:glycosyltransferase [Alkalicaulis satelles]|uniref:Glycosyltransferase n=1 Tax=Alkalicaulis satelles TaxID=2609175 RepID=A0A5M6ZMU4_9PROT|nr:TIGR04283 family arsenosugar biosynthesis glycosyltransferase [Alkalicaulis satelles]KAA5805235.1 glycosyltransferase [Alkalicaulis satelles]